MIKRTPVATSEPRAPRSRQARREAIAGYLFISPVVVLFVTFIAGPLLATIAFSFVKWDLLTEPSFAGFDNYARLATDPVIGRALANTFIFAFASVVSHVGIGLLLAVAVNRQINRIVQYWIRTALFFPFLISWAAVSLIWKYALDPNFGFINHYLQQLGLNPPEWLVDPNWALPALIGVDWWHTIGYTFVILLAGLQTVPRELHEAAMVDGAGAVRRFWSVTIPAMSPTLFFTMIITFIGAFQIFDPMYIMTNGGPGDATRSIVQYLYEQAFKAFDVGYGAVVAIIVFVVIVVVTLIQFRLSRKWVSE
ncbi:MAG: sugar ABC transporter permease [Propionicimonas sp.]